MKRQTRAFLLNAFTGIAIAAAAALMLLPTAASAAPANATTTVNVRAAPDGSARIVGRLSSGDAVEADGCDANWCYVRNRRVEGYVARRFLSGLGPAVNFGFTIQGPEGNSVTFGINNQPDRPLPPPPDDEPEFVDGEACFYERSQLRGGSFCVAAGDEIRDLGGWSGDISSIENLDGLDVTVCTRTRLRGDCRTYTTSSRSLGRFDNAIQSLSVD